MRISDIILKKPYCFFTMKVITWLNYCFIMLLPLCGFSQGNAELVQQVGHSGIAQSFALSPDGRKLLTCGGDKTVKLWDIYVGKEVRTYVGHANEVYVVKFASDGKSFISGGYDKDIIWWDIETGKILKRFLGHSEAVMSLFFSNDMKSIISASSDGTIKIWSTETGQTIKTINGSNSRTSITQDGSKIAGSYNNTIYIWDLNTGDILKTLTGHKEDVNSLSISPDGKRIVSATMGFKPGGSIDELKYWNVETGSQIGLSSVNLKTERTVCFSPDGKLFASGGQGKSISIWNSETGKLVKSIPCKWVIMGLLFTSDNKKIIDLEDDNSIHIWDIESGQEVRVMKGYSNRVASVACNKVGGQFASTSVENIIIWDLKAGKIDKLLTGNTDYVYNVNYSPNQKKIISGSRNHFIKTWNIETGKPELSLSFGGNEVSSVSYSSDEKVILAANRDKTIKILDAVSGKELQSFTGPKSYVNTVAFSPSENKIIAASGDYFKNLQSSPDDIRVWDVNTGKELFKLCESTDWYTSASFSPDEKTILSSSLYNKNCTLWDAETGKELKVFNGHTDDVNIAAFLPDGKKFISGSSDNTLKLWDIETGAELKTLSGHNKAIAALTVTSDGKRVFSGSLDCSVKLWDIESGKEIASFILVDKNDYIIATPDNYYIASRGAFKGVAFRIGNNVFPFEQFDLKFNRPDIVLQRLGFASPNVIASYKNAYLKRLKKMKFTESMLGSDFHLPEVEIVSDSIPTSTPIKSFTFKIRAKDSKYLLDRLNIYINDVPVYGSNGINLRLKKTMKLDQEIKLNLLDGDNKIQVSVLNNKGAESLRQTINVKHIGSGTKSELYVVAIGVSEFIDNKFNLTYAAKDASDIAAEFSQNSNFSKVNVLPYYNNTATKENIVKAKETLLKSKPDDMVIIFAATHGLLDNNMNYYLATHDIDFNNPSIKGLPYEDLENLLDGIPACRKVMLIDACHSGEVDKDEMQLVDYVNAVGNVKSRGFKALKQKENMIGVQNSFDLMSELFADLRRGTGAIVISSAGGAEFALESSEWKNGVFTFSVLEGLKNGKANINNDKEITVSELRNYVFSRVKELTNGQQNPTVRQDNLEFDFKIW